MARKKRASKTLDFAESRINSLTAINEKLDLGGGLTLETYSNLVNRLRDMLDKYNIKLSELDAEATAISQTEDAVADMTERMLAGVAAHFGKDSLEYEKAGGKRKSEIKRPAKKPKAPKTQ